MGYDPIEATLAASQAIEALERSGRVGRKTVVLTELLPETEFRVIYDESKGLYSGNRAGNVVEEAEVAFKEAMGIAGDQLRKQIPVILEFDGVESKKTAYYRYTDFYGDMIWVGNASLISDVFDNTGESFLVVFLYGQLAMVTASAGEYHTVRISHENETIHPIDPEFIPWDSMPGGGSGGGLPVVDIPVNDDETVTDSTVFATVDTFASSGVIAFVGKFHGAGFLTCTLMLFADHGELGKGYTSVEGMSFYYKNGAWSFSFAG